MKITDPYSAAELEPPTHDRSSSPDTAPLLHPSELLLNSLLETDAVGILVFDDQGCLIRANDVFYRMTGYNPRQVARRELTWRTLTPPEWVAVSEAQMERFAITGRVGPYEKEYFLADGSRRWMLFAGRAVGDGTISEYCIDITVHKRTEDALRDSEERYRTLFETMDEGFALCKLVRNDFGEAIDYRILQLNPAFEKLSGIPPRQAVGRLNSEVIPGFDPWWPRRFAQVVDSGIPARFEHEIPQFNAWLEVRAFPRPDDSFYVLYENITERKRNEQALARASAESNRWRQLYQAVLANTPDLGYVFSPDHRFTYANDALLALWGKTWDQAIGKTCLELGYPDWHAAMHNREIDQVIATGQPVRGEVPFSGTHGTRVYDYIFFPVFNAAGQVQAVGGTTRDITDIRNAVSALRESNERFRMFVENVREYALIQTSADSQPDAAHTINGWNPGAERMFGYTGAEILGKSFSLLLTPEDAASTLLADEFDSAARAERNEEARWLVRKDGSRLWTRWISEPIRDESGTVCGLVRVLRDETERLRTETSMRQSEKLAVVGRLASSIAHEINNPLEAVTNLIFLARNEAVPPSVAHYLDLAQQELRRITHITIETLRFHRQASAPVPSDIVEIIQSVLLLHEGRLRAAQIETLRRFREHPTILCIPNEIRQVVANLIGNAVDAMIKNTGPRTLAIRVHRATDPRTNAPGVRITIADSGSGIPAALREHLFEPFFTTKETTGTGLGLWVSDEIVRRHNGVLRFRSRDADPHRGTAFSLFLHEQTLLQPRENTESN